MSFISYTYNGYNSATKQYTYTLVDSEFGAAEVEAGAVAGVVGGVAVAKEYSKRGLKVGRNLALLVIYYHKQYRDSIADLKRWQDAYCPRYIESWDMYAKERDEHLNKLLSLT